MKATGIVRRIDDLGRVVIPKELRRTMGIADGDPLEIFVQGDTVVLKKYANSCRLCGSSLAELEEVYPDQHICHGCMEIIAQQRDRLIKAMGKADA